MGFLLFLVAYFLFLPLSFATFCILLAKGKSSGYFRSSASNIDRFANREFRTLWNVTLRKPYSYEFGDFRETLSSVLGKLQRDNKLTRTGKILSSFLDFIDKGHCYKSIMDFENYNL